MDKRKICEPVVVYSRKSERLKTKKLKTVKKKEKLKVKILRHNVKPICKKAAFKSALVAESEYDSTKNKQKINDMFGSQKIQVSKLKNTEAENYQGIAKKELEKNSACPFCEKKFTSESGVSMHVAKKHKNVCSICQLPFKSYIECLEHLKIHGIYREEGMYKCEMCTKIFRRHEGLQKHQISHTISKTFECQICHQKLKTSNTLHYHMKVKHSDSIKRYTCETCQKHFWTKSDLNVHVRVHTNDRPFMCHICSKSFKYSGNLAEHHRRVHDKQVLLCDLCGLDFRVKKAYLIHCIEVHGMKDKKDELPIDNIQYPCDTCGKLFNRRHDLKVHFRIHSGEKPYKCESCEKSFRCWTHLKQHRVQHTGIKAHQCKYCSKRFSQYANVNVHMKNSCPARVYKPKDEALPHGEFKNSEFTGLMAGLKSNNKDTVNGSEKADATKTVSLREDNQLNNTTSVATFCDFDVVTVGQNNKRKKLFDPQNHITKYTKLVKNGQDFQNEYEKDVSEKQQLYNVEVKVEENLMLDVQNTEIDLSENPEIILEDNNQLVYLVSVPGKTVSNDDSKETITFHDVSVPGQNVHINGDLKETIIFEDVSVPGKTVANDNSKEIITFHDVTVSGQGTCIINGHSKKMINFHDVSVPEQYPGIDMLKDVNTVLDNGLSVESQTATVDKEDGQNSEKNLIVFKKETPPIESVILSDDGPFGTIISEIEESTEHIQSYSD